MKVAIPVKKFERWFLPLLALLLVVLYIALILPFTGLVGGLLWLLTGWLFPSLINLLLTAFIISFIKHPIWRYCLLLPISFVLAAAVEAPALWKLIIDPPPTEEFVNAPTQLDGIRSIMVSANGYSNDPVVLNPLDARVEASGDEGCGCMYWRLSEGYVQHLSRYLETATARSVTMGGGLRVRAFVSIETTPHGDNPKLADILIEVHDGTAINASFRKRNLIRLDYLRDNTGRTRILNGHFLENVFHTLSHETFWTPVVTWFLDRDIRIFLGKAFAT